MTGSIPGEVADDFRTTILSKQEIITFDESAGLVANRCEQFDQVYVRRKGHVLRLCQPQGSEDQIAPRDQRSMQQSTQLVTATIHGGNAPLYAIIIPTM